MDIILYSTGCPKCNILKKKLLEKNIVFEENTSVDEMIEMGLMEAPALGVDGEIFNFPKAIEWVNNR